MRKLPPNWRRSAHQLHLEQAIERCVNSAAELLYALRGLETTVAIEGCPRQSAHDALVRHRAKFAVDDLTLHSILNALINRN